MSHFLLLLLLLLITVSMQFPLSDGCSICCVIDQHCLLKPLSAAVVAS